MLTFQGTENSEDLGGPVLDKGFVVHKVDAFEGGTHVGYLKISYIPSERVGVVFPTVWHFQQRWHGVCLGLRDRKTRLVVGAEGLDDLKILTEVWARAHLHRLTTSPSCPGVAFNALSSACAPSKEVMQQELGDMAGRHGLQGRMDKALAYFLDKPFVDYARIHEAFRGKGLGTPLYVGAAKWLAETKSMSLRASGTQTPEAQRLWDSIERNPDLPVIRVTLDGKSFQMLDYTENQNFSKTAYEVT